MKVKTNRAIVLISGMMIQLCAGIIYMWSVFRKPVSEYLVNNPAWEKASLVSSFMLAAFVLGIILGGRIQDKTGPRPVIACGSILISLGMVLTAFLATPAHPYMIFLTYSVLGGIGVGFVYTTTVSTVQKWFPDKRGFATGMMVCAFGFSLVIFSPIATKLLSMDNGVKNTFLIFGCTFLVVCLLCSLFITNPSEDFAVKTSAQSKSPVSIKHYTTLEMLKTPQFYLIAVSMMLILPAYFILNPQFKTLAMSRGFTDASATAVVMVTGVASASGRLLFSWLSDAIGRKGAIISIIAVTLTAVLGLTAAEGALFLICIGAIAFAFGGSAGVYPALTADNFGTKYMGMNYGCVMVGFGISGLIFPLISLEIAIKTSLIIAAATCVVSLILVLLIKSPKRD